MAQGHWASAGYRAAPSLGCWTGQSGGHRARRPALMDMTAPTVPLHLVGNAWNPLAALKAMAVGAAGALVPFVGNHRRGEGMDLPGGGRGEQGKREQKGEGSHQSFSTRQAHFL